MSCATIFKLHLPQEQKKNVIFINTSQGIFTK